MNTREHENPIVEIGEGSFVHPTTILQGTSKITIGKNCYIGPFCYIRGNLRIGDDCWIGPHCDIHAEGSILIGNKVGIGSHVVMLTGQHDISGTGPITDNQIVLKPIEIGDGSDIGVGTIILGGLTIGKGAQIGAGAVVKGTVPDYEIWVGNLATKIGER